MAKFSKLKTILKTSALPGIVQKAILKEAKGKLAKDGGDETEIAKAIVSKYHDTVNSDLKTVRAARRQ
jgi:hypothetical protein